MDRTDEYMNLIDTDKQTPLPPKKSLFYDTIFLEIQKLDKGLSPTLTYRNLIQIENKLDKISENIKDTLSVISINGTEDEIVHFEGVKKIIQNYLLKIRMNIEKMKIKKTNKSLELESEKPKKYKEVENRSYFEQENIQIIENSVTDRYRQTRQRLLEIESIQENITENLNIQDERIDEIIDKAGHIYHTVVNSRKIIEEDSGNTRFFRRFFTLLMFCLTFVLFFLSLYYK